jgi:hypothetical protein
MQLVASQDELTGSVVQPRGKNQDPGVHACDFDELTYFGHRVFPLPL